MDFIIFSWDRCRFGSRVTHHSPLDCATRYVSGRRSLTAPISVTCIGSLFN